MTLSDDRIQLQIDGRQIEVDAGTTILEAAVQLGIDVPVLCHSSRLDPAGVCRMCVVDVGERALAPSCLRECQSGMEVTATSDELTQHRRVLTQLLLADHPIPCRRESSTGDCELESLGRSFDLIENQKTEPLWPDIEPVIEQPAAEPKPAGDESTRLDTSSPVIEVDHAACILCDRCVRACDDVQSNHIIGRTGKGRTATIAFDLNQPMGQSNCVSCGECVSECPTGALTNKDITQPVIPLEQLEHSATVCPYCGVGCATSVYTESDQIVRTEGRQSPVNDERLCVKGRYGWDYGFHPQRLQRPLIRRTDFYPKGPLSNDVRGVQQSPKNRKPGKLVDESQVLPAFREASWDEALELIADRLKATRKQYGSDSLAGFGSAKCSNEEAYLFQKMIRAGLGTNNVDHCTRLCHASSVAALMETIGSGAVTNVFADVRNSDVALITGSNAPANHPVAATFIKEATRNGTALIIVDVRRNELADFAEEFVCIRPGSDVAFYNGVMHVLIRDGLIDQEFINDRTSGFDDLSRLLLEEYSPVQSSAICGVEVDQIERVARRVGRAGSMLIFWGMGISQHVTGTDNARCLISLCLLTGNVGRPGTGLHPLRGQNNVQGASDAGLIPMVYPDYQSVSDPEVRARFEAAWGCSLSPDPGKTVVEIINAALTGEIRSMLIMGENPFLSDPNINKVRKALSALDFLVVQDIFLTETAEFADVILPAGNYFEKTGTYTNTDRRVQIGREVVASPGEARPDWQILLDLSRRLGVKSDYETPEEVFSEFTQLTTNYSGMSFEALGTEGQLWPFLPGDREGRQLLFADRFPTADGRGKFVPCPYRPPAEIPDEGYPFVLSTGRVLEHWHTGSMTRRSYALNSIQPTAFAAINPSDLDQLGIGDGESIRLVSRRGQIEISARSDKSVERGNVFVPFHFREAAANVLTNDQLDPYGKIPEFKYCAIRVERLESANVRT